MSIRFTLLCLLLALPFAGAAQQKTERQQLVTAFVRNAAALMASEELCQFQLNVETLGQTFTVYGLEPQDLEPGGRLHDELLWNQKHIAALTTNESGRQDFCNRVKEKLGSLLN